MEAVKQETIVVQIPVQENHLGILVGKYEIPALCECGARRAVKRWEGRSFDGGQRVAIVDRWENECGHLDTYEKVRNIGRLLTDETGDPNLAG